MGLPVNQIICGDSLKVIPLIEDESVDLIILDPPYQDWSYWCEMGLLAWTIRLLPPSGNFLCFTKQPFDFVVRNEIDRVLRREIIWTFTNGGAWISNKMPLVSHQKIYWGALSKECFFNPHTGQEYSKATKEFKRGKKVFGGYCEDGREYKPSKEGTWLRDHLHFNKPCEGAIPAKPLKLMEILIQCFCPLGGLVFDPFCGSGTSCVAAKMLDRNYSGVDIDEECCEMTRQRIKAIETGVPTKEQRKGQKGLFE